MRALLREYRPSVVTGGAAIGPILVLAALNAADELDRTAFAVLLPEIRDYFGVSLGTILTITALANLFPYLLALPIGYYSDRGNRRWLVIVGSFLWVVFSLLTGFSTTLWFLGLCRLGSELGKITDPAQTSLITDLYPPDRRAGAFAIFTMGNTVGILVAPVTAGFLASIWFWQVPFLLFFVPSVILSIVALFVLREPKRGEQELRLAGDSEGDVDAGIEAPPTWTESWRIAKGVRTLRRIWLSLPFLVGSFVGIATLIVTYYDEVHDLGESTRGLLVSIGNGMGLIGVIVGGAIGNRLHVRKPGKVVVYAAALAVVPALAFLVIAVAPWLWLGVAASWAAALITPALGPQLIALISRVIPPRARGFALAASSLFVAPGLFVAPIAGSIADNLGIRWGIVALVPVFLLGAFILGTAGASVESDIRAATAAAVAKQVSREGSKLLVCRDVDVHYGQVQILFGVDFEVDEGEIVALLGTNGAGKSTLLNAIGGVAQASNGAIFFAGEDITYLPAPDHVERGIVQVPGARACSRP